MLRLEGPFGSWNLKNLDFYKPWFSQIKVLYIFIPIFEILLEPFISLERWMWRHIFMRKLGVEGKFQKVVQSIVFTLLKKQNQVLIFNSYFF